MTRAEDEDDDDDDLGLARRSLEAEVRDELVHQVVVQGVELP